MRNQTNYVISLKEVEKSCAFRKQVERSKKLAEHEKK